MSEREYQFAGFFDGEGYVGASLATANAGAYLRCTATNMDRRVLDLFVAKFGGRLGRSRTLRPDGRAFAWVWSLNGAAAKEFLRYVVDDVVVKKEQVVAALRWPLALDGPDKELKDDQRALRLEIYHELKRLKRTFGAADVEAPREGGADGDAARVQEAARLYRAGQTINRVAAALDEKYSTIARWMEQLGIRRSREEATAIMSANRMAELEHRPDVREAIALYRRGLSVVDVATEMNREPATVNNWLRRMGEIRSLTDAQRLRRSRANKPKPVDTRTPEDIEIERRIKISAKRKGMVFSDEHRAKLAAAKVGRKASDETKARMSASHRKEQ